MGRFDGYPVLSGAESGGFSWGYISVPSASGEYGAIFVQGPDGSRAGLQWEIADSPYLMRLEGPAEGHWGLYRAGFRTPAPTAEDLAANLQAILPKLKVIYSRVRNQ